MKRHVSAAIILPLLLGFGTLSGALAATTNLVAVADTALRSTVPDNNFGAALQLPLGVAKFGPPINRCLFRFNVADIPTNAIITSATLRLIQVVPDPTPPAGFDVNRVLKDWGEGTGTDGVGHTGAAAQTGEATWNSRLHPSSPWDAGGGQAGSDYVATPSATNQISGTTNDFTSAGLVADVQFWRENPEANFGWIVLATDEPTDTGKLIGSRENPGNAPTLIVEYSLPTTAAPPSAPTIFGTALSGNQIRFSFNAESNRTYAVEFRDSLNDGAWGVLTNLPAQPADTTVDITNVLSSPERYFRARTP